MKHGVWKPIVSGQRFGGGAACIALAMVLARGAEAQSLDRGILWSSPPAPGESWIPSSVSIGNHGTQVFGHLQGTSTYAKLLSAHDSGVPTPIWSQVLPAWSTTAVAVSAAYEDRHVAMHQHYQGSPGSVQRVRLQGFRTAESTPEWSYTLPVDIYNHTISNLWMSREGDRVVVMAHDSILNQLRVAVLEPLSPSFNPDQPAPTHLLTFPSGTMLKGARLSGDGTILVLSYTSYTKAIDTRSGVEVLHQSTAGLPLTEAVGVSGNGNWFTLGTENGFRAYRRQGSGSWVLDFVHTISTPGVCTALDNSDDGGTIAAGYALYSSASVRVQAVDRVSRAVLVDRTWTGGGSFSNKVSDIAICSNGEYLVAGFWGDELQSMPRLVTFRRGSSTPIGAYNLPGSVSSVDISRDGRRFAAAVRSNHANQGASGGRVECYNLVDRDMGIDGLPQAGSTITFRWRPSSPGGQVILLRSRELAAMPMQLPGVSGTLYLPRDAIVFLPGSIGTDGLAWRSYVVPRAADSIGTSFYFQGFSSSPRALTEDWLKLTVLP